MTAVAEKFCFYRAVPLKDMYTKLRGVYIYLYGTCVRYFNVPAEVRDGQQGWGAVVTSLTPSCSEDGKGTNG